MTIRFKPCCIFGLIVCLALAMAGANGQQTSHSRGVTPEDYYAFEFVSDPQISPDGKLVAYVVTKIDRAQNRRNSSIWMVATDGSRTAMAVYDQSAIFDFTALEP